MSRNLGLNYIQAGIFSLRYIVIKPSESGKEFCIVNVQLDELNDMSAKSLYSNGNHVLFYGNDLLHRASTNFKQFHRVHQRRLLSKQATKLSFSGFPIPGLNNGQGNYFYTIQGVMKTVFEFVDSLANIKSLFAALETIWMSSPNDVDLSGTMSYIVNTNQLKACFPDDPNFPNPEIPTHDLLSPMLDAIDQVRTQLSDEPVLHLLSELSDLLNGYQSLIHRIGLQDTEAIIRHQESLVQALIQHDEDHNLDVAERLLNETCGWVAEKFVGFCSEIQEKSTNFKKEHISTIDNLPSDESMCEAIFPYCMRRLLEPWLMNSHNYVKETGELRNRHHATVDIYPFLLLILEFSNNVLVSGVSHVIYPRLVGTAKRSNNLTC